MNELSRAGFRLTLVALLVASWCAYALAVPKSAGTAALRAAMAKKVPAKPGTAGVSWINGGQRLDPKTMAGMLEKARAISAEVNAKSGDHGIPEEDRRPGDDDPGVVVPMMVNYLASPDPDYRRQAAMTMCDNRFAKWERAGEAIPALELAAAEKDPDTAEFAQLAIKRIRFWQTKRAKP